MKLLIWLMPLSYLFTSVTFDPVQGSIFLPTPASIPKITVPIIKRRRIKKNQKGRRQIGNETLNKLLRQLELLPKPKELMQREPESSLIIRRTKGKRKKKHLEMKDDIVKNVIQIQRDLSSQIQEKRETTTSTTSTTISPRTSRSTTTTESTSTTTTKLPIPTKRTTYRSIHPLPTRLPKSISNISPTKRLYRPKDSFGQESRTLTKYTPEHNIKPMVYFKQVTPIRKTFSSTTSFSPTFPHFPVRNMSTPPTFMSREPSAAIQFKKNDKKSGSIKKNVTTSSRPSWNYHRDIHRLSSQKEEFEEEEPTNYWIAPLKKKEKITNKPKLLKSTFIQDSKTSRPQFKSNYKYSSLTTDQNATSKKEYLKKPTRLHRPKAKIQSLKKQENKSLPKWDSSRNRLNQRRTRKTLVNKSTATLPSLSTTKPPNKVKITTVNAEELTFPSWTASPLTEDMKVKVSQLTETPRPTFYQPWTPPLNKIEVIPDESEINTENYYSSSWNPSPIIHKESKIQKSIEVERQRSIHNWRASSSKEPVRKSPTTTETIETTQKIISSISTTKQSQFYEPQRKSYISKSPDSDWTPYSKENSDPSNDKKTNTQSRLQFLPSTESKQNAMDYNQSSIDKWIEQDIKSPSEPSDVKIKESFTSWNPPSFHNLESEIYSSSWNEEDNSPEPSQNQRRKKLDPIWSLSRQITREPSASFDAEDSWNTTPKTVDVRQINDAALRSYPQTYRAPSPRKKQPLRNVYGRKRYNSASSKNANDWNVPDQYKKLLVYDPYRYKGNSNGVSSPVGVDDISTFTKPGPPYLDDKITQYVPKLVSTTRSTITSTRRTTTTTKRPIPANLETFEVNPHRLPKYSWPSSEPVISPQLSPSPPFFEAEHANKYYSTDVYTPNSFAQLDNDDHSNYGRGIKDSHLVDYGAYSGSHGAFGWYADIPVELH